MSSSYEDISIFIWIFQIWSFLSPINKSKFLLRQFSFAVWSMAHFGFAMLELSLVFIHLSDTFHNGLIIGRILDITQVVMPILTHLVFICETFFNWNIQSKMWEVINTVEERRKLIEVFKVGFTKIFLIEASTLAFVGIVTEAIIVASVMTDAQFARSWYLRLWSLYMIRFGMIQLIFYVGWIRCHMNVIREGLLNAKNDESKVKLLSEMKVLYRDIWLFSVYFNKRFAWSSLALMIHLFITIVICLYWVVARFYYNLLSVRYLGASLIMCVSPVTNLLVLIYSCQQCVKQANQVGHSLHLMKLNHSTQFLVLSLAKINIYLRYEKTFQVHNFSLQVKLLPISICGWRFFLMDFPFLIDVFSACASYILLIYSIK